CAYLEHGEEHKHAKVHIPAAEEEAEAEPLRHRTIRWVPDPAIPVHCIPLGHVSICGLFFILMSCSLCVCFILVWYVLFWFVFPCSAPPAATQCSLSTLRS